MHKAIYIYSCGIGFTPCKELSAFIEHADFIYGSQNLFSALPKHSAKEICINANAREQAKEILSYAKNGKKILVLCSGDSLYHGFGTTLLSLTTDKEQEKYIEIIPNITAFQALCSKCKIPWQDAELFTAHFSEHIPVRKIANAKKALIYCGTKFTAAVIARELCTFSPKQKERQTIFAERLGTVHEKILQAKLETICTLETHPTSMLLLLPCINEEINKEIDEENKTKSSVMQIRRETCLPLGLDDEIFTKENHLITQSDCRAVILSRLRLLPEGVLWDLGAGSGAVGLEAAGLCGMQVYGVEKNPARCQHIEENRKKLGIGNYSLAQGNILDKISELPAADRIFVGGAGKDIHAVLDKCKTYGKKNALIAVSAVTLETYHLLYGYQNLPRLDCLQINICREQTIAEKYHALKPINPLYLFIFQNQKQE